MTDTTDGPTAWWAERITISPSGCWLWNLYVNQNGYGTVGAGPGVRRKVKAHRLAYEQYIGPIPVGLQLDHLCRVRHCVNPDHLEPVTMRENQLRGDTHTAIVHLTGRCVSGLHQMAGENVCEDRRGNRWCRACARSRRLQRDLAKRQERTNA